MSSNAFINTMASITLAGFVAEMLRTIYEARPNNKTMLDLCNRTWRQVDEARNLWERCDAKDLAQIEKRLKFFETQILRKVIPIPELTSTALGMLDAVHVHLSGRKAEAIGALAASIQRIHNYYDRRLDRLADYEAAGETVERWQEVVNE